MNLKDYLDNQKYLIDEALDEFLPAEKEEPVAIHRAMRYGVLSGGKRIRPILVIETCDVCDGSREEAITAACAIELVHAYSLIHDDLPSMDNDDMRRGKPTCHKAFGEANAILTGDALLTLAFNVLAKNLGPETGVLAIRELSDAAGTYGMVGGQAMDLESRDKVCDPDCLRSINSLKTARLFEASCKIGGIIAEAAPKKIAALGKYGAALGMAFQITDDAMDEEGYVKLVGAAKARLEARDLVKKAKDALAIFNDKADRLKELADFVVERKE